MTRTLTLCLALTALFVAICMIALPTPVSSDLRAMWMAGKFLAEGRADLVYPKDSTVFTMLPPSEWYDHLRTEGGTGELFPFLYPPLWAAVMARLSAETGLNGLIGVASVLNPVLLAGCVLLAARIARVPLAPERFLLAGLAIQLFTTSGVVAIGQNQPQIAVAFLTLLAIERSERGGSVAAGIALALAASIKVFPALLALVWMASGRWRAVAAFVVAGAALAALSVQLAGWPLHAEFLRLLRVISGTAMTTNFTYGIDGLIAPAVLGESAVFVQSPARDPALGAAAGWTVISKPSALIVVQSVLQLCVALWAGRALVQGNGTTSRRAAIWAAALALLAFLGPIAWAYYYVAPLALLPVVLARLTPAQSVLALCLCLVPLCAWLRFPMLSLGMLDRPLHLAGPAGVLILVAVFVIAARPAGAVRLD